MAEDYVTRLDEISELEDLDRQRLPGGVSLCYKTTSWKERTPQWPFSGLRRFHRNREYHSE